MKVKIFLLLTICFFTISGEEKQIKKWAVKLADLRQEINLLNSQINREKITSSGSLSALVRKKAMLEEELEREKAAKNEALKEREKLKTKIDEKEKTETALKPMILEKITKMEQVVKAGLPFRIKERMTALESMKKKLESSLTGAFETASELYRFINDELSLSRETALVKIMIKESDSDTPVLVDAVRLGMAELYTRRNGNFGMFEKSENGEWKFRKISDSEAESVKILFETMEKNISEGFFTLPLRKTDGGGNEE